MTIDVNELDEGTVPISFGNTVDKDVFDTLRVTTGFGVFDNKNIYNKSEAVFNEFVNGAGASVTHNSDTIAVELNVGSDIGEVAIRQSSRYLAYVPRKSQDITVTFVGSPNREGVTKRAGLFDDTNGPYFEIDGNTLSFVIRTDTSGAVSDTTFRISQDAWNGDRLDGNGGEFNRTGITIDSTKGQVFFTTFGWLGFASVQLGFYINGKRIICHTFENSNRLDAVYMGRPTLPIRYEIRNKTATAGSTTFQEICCSVSSEGGYTLPGLEFATGIDITTPRTVTTTEIPLLALRLKNTFGLKANRTTGKFLFADLYNTGGNVQYTLYHVHNPSSVIGTFSEVHHDSAMEISLDITSYTGSEIHPIAIKKVPTGVGSSSVGESIISTEFLSEHNFISQDITSTNSQMFVLAGKVSTGTGASAPSIDYIEFG